jgi:hypothetical protein
MWREGKGGKWELLHTTEYYILMYVSLVVCIELLMWKTPHGEVNILHSFLNICVHTPH